MYRFFLNTMQMFSQLSYHLLKIILQRFKYIFLIGLLGLDYIAVGQAAILFTKKNTQWMSDHHQSISDTNFVLDFFKFQNNKEKTLLGSQKEWMIKRVSKQSPFSPRIIVNALITSEKFLLLQNSKVWTVLQEQLKNPLKEKCIDLKGVCLLNPWLTGYITFKDIDLRLENIYTWAVILRHPSQLFYFAYGKHLAPFSIYSTDSVQKSIFLPDVIPNLKHRLGVITNTQFSIGIALPKRFLANTQFYGFGKIREYYGLSVRHYYDFLAYTIQIGIGAVTRLPGRKVNPNYNSYFERPYFNSYVDIVYGATHVKGELMIALAKLNKLTILKTNDCDHQRPYTLSFELFSSFPKYRYVHSIRIGTHYLRNSPFVMLPLPLNEMPAEIVVSPFDLCHTFALLQFKIKQMYLTVGYEHNVLLRTNDKPFQKGIHLQLKFAM